MPRSAHALLAIPLVLGTLWAIYQPSIGQDVLWVTAPAAVLLAWIVTSTDDRKLAEEMEAWRKRSGKRKARVVFEGYRTPAVVRTPDRRDLARKQLGPEPDGGKAKKVVSPPWELSSMVEAAGGGRQVGVYQLLPKLAYVIAVEADAMSSSDFIAVVARLEAKRSEITVRPRVADDRPTARTVQLKDLRFNAAFITEAADGRSAKELLSEGVREVLLEHKAGWLFVRGDSMALVRYGHVDAAKVHALVDAADAIFAEIGAEGGPSLLGEEEEAPPSLASKSKKPAVARA